MNTHLDKFEHGPPPCLVQIKDLEALGLSVVAGRKCQRTVRIDGKLYVEGALKALLAEAHDNIFEDNGQGRPNGTTRMPRPT
jgi:hypothetical protein